EAALDQLRQRIHDGGRVAPGGGDANTAPRTGGEHHEPHDRRAADLVAIFLHRHLGVVAADDLDEFGGSTGMQAALVDNRKFAGDRSVLQIAPLFFHFPLRNLLATLMYLRPAACASSSAVAMSSFTRMLESLISMGRLTPAITSTRPESMTEMARLEGVPPNMSVRMMTPEPVSQCFIASTISRRRCSMSSSAPMETVSKCCCAPTTCSTALRNSSAKRPCVTSTIPIMQCWLPACPIHGCFV